MAFSKFFRNFNRNSADRFCGTFNEAIPIGLYSSDILGKAIHLCDYKFIKYFKYDDISLGR